MRAARLGLLVASALACAHVSPDTSAPSDFWQALALQPVQTTGPVVLRGHVTLVSFFATWCFPCIALVPRLMQLQEAHAREGLQVVGIGMDLEGGAVLEPFVEHYALNFPVFYPSPEMRLGKSAFGAIPELPLTVVLGRRGELLTAYGGMLEVGGLEKLIQQALKAK